MLSGGADEGRPLPAELQGVDWQLVEVTESGTTRDVAEVDGTLHFEGSTVSGRACNSYGARTAKVTADEIRTAGFDSTQMACEDVRGELDELTQRVLRAGAAWSLDDDVLVLRSGDLALTYRPRDGVFSSRTATGPAPAARRIARSSSSRRPGHRAGGVRALVPLPTGGGCAHKPCASRAGPSASTG